MAGDKAFTQAPIITNGQYPIAHYLDTSDTTDSPEGTFKPLTQNHLQAVENLNANLELVIDNGTLKSQITGSLIEDFVFHESSTSPNQGNVLEVGNFKTLTVEIFGGSTTREVEFVCRSISGLNRKLRGINVSDWSDGTSTTGTAEIWQFDITGLRQVYFDLTEVSGDYVAIKGRVVA
ncbi:hypothetical protein [Paraliobacillus ryukyuensis]|uniref:hypothetical protein n=1 Tax=Paraliobacillus ryukyuensis TaxID=200904 RepID=UPI0009A6064A|nr:hypothetical protein [Paraliobacillus ryukyuensis]